MNHPQQRLEQRPEPGAAGDDQTARLRASVTRSLIRAARHGRARARAETALRAATTAVVRLIVDLDAYRDAAEVTDLVGAAGEHFSPLADWDTATGDAPDWLTAAAAEFTAFHIAQHARERDTAHDHAARLTGQAAALRRLLETALHLRMHGDHAPGGSETWHAWDHDTVATLRDLDQTTPATGERQCQTCGDPITRNGDRWHHHDGDRAHHPEPLLSDDERLEQLMAMPAALLQPEANELRDAVRQLRAERDTARAQLAGAHARGEYLYRRLINTRKEAQGRKEHGQRLRAELDELRAQHRQRGPGITAI